MSARRWLLLTAGLGLFAVLLSQASLEKVLATLLGADMALVALAFGSALLATLLRTIRFGVLVPPAGRWMQLFGLFSAMRLPNLLMPLKSGELAFVVALKKAGFVPSVFRVAPVWLMLRTTDAIAVALWLSVALALHPLDGRFEGIRWVLVLGALAVAAGLIGLAAWAGRRKPFGATGRLARAVAAMQEGFVTAGNAGSWVRTMFLALGIWVCMVGFSVLVQVALGTPLGLLECAVVALGALSASLLPIHAPLGIGTGDAVWTGVMVLVGVDVDTALPLAIGIRLTSLASLLVESLLGAAILTSTRPRHLRRLDENVVSPQEDTSKNH